MSTRCNIIIKGSCGSEINLYHHHDGYPGGVGVELEEICRILRKKRLYYDEESLANHLIKRGVIIDNLNGTTFHDKEYEAASSIHGDIDYLYYLYVKPHSKCEWMYKVECFQKIRLGYRDNAWRKVQIPDPTNNPAHVDENQF